MCNYFYIDIELLLRCFKRIRSENRELDKKYCFEAVL